ncbi:hypothetical protein N7524_001363 [Penicillium chrysogenum]|nr:hypothetical protein N7524_001363 [Penicillium chrysogenum]
MATRTCFVTLERLSKSSSDGQPVLQTQVEEARRTMWSCLMMEAMLGCGDLRSLGYQSRMYRVPLPSSDEDFVFSVCPKNDLKYLDILDLEISDPPKMQRCGGKGYDINFTLIIQGFNIWSEVSRWASAKITQASSASRWLSLPEDPFWGRSLVVLEDWRNAQSSRLHFSNVDSSLPAFLSRKQGERYALINLIYYSTSIFLHRECLPFIFNKGTLQPRAAEVGASFQQILSNGWETSVEKLAESACNTIHLIRQLLHHGIDLQVPFSCYCVFNAATVLVYARKWPEIMPEGSNAVELFDWGVEWVSRASEIWEVARVWRITLMKIDSFHNGPARSTSRTTAPLPRSSPNAQALGDLRSAPPSFSVEWTCSRPLEDDAISDDLSAIWDSIIAYPTQTLPTLDYNFHSITPHLDTS